LFSFFVLYELSTPKFHTLGRIPGTFVYKNVEQYKNAIVIPGILVAKLNSDLLFTATTVFIDELESKIDKALYEVHAIVLDCSAISLMDSAGAVAMCDVKASLDTRNISLFLANLNSDVEGTLQCSGFFKKFDKDNVLLHVHDAVVKAKQETATKLLALRKQKEEAKLADNTEKAIVETNAAEAAAEFAVEIASEADETIGSASYYSQFKNAINRTEQQT